MPSTRPSRISELTGQRVAAGILSWKSEHTLENSLAEHRRLGLFDLFDDFVIHFQEIRAEDRARAEKYGLRHIGSSHNRHIGGGFYHLLNNLDADYVFLLEDDLTFAVEADTLATTLAEAIGLMQAGHMDQFLCRRDDMVRSGYEKYFPLTRFDADHNAGIKGIRADVPTFGRWLRRSLHPAQADKHLGKIVWFESAPEQVRPDVVKKFARPGNDFYVVSGRATKWAHPAMLASRRHLLEVYDHINAGTPGFAEFGRCLETLINDGPFRPWWLRQNYRIGYTKPVMTLHNRHADGGKLGFRDTGLDAPNPAR